MGAWLYSQRSRHENSVTGTESSDGVIHLIYKWGKHCIDAASSCFYARLTGASTNDVRLDLPG